LVADCSLVQKNGTTFQHNIPQPLHSIQAGAGAFYIWGKFINATDFYGSYRQEHNLFCNVSSRPDVLCV
jgi:hypothetical protein